MNRLIDVAVSRYRLVLLLVFLATLPFLWFYAHQSFRNHINDFFEDDDADIAYYTAFQEVFGNDEVMAVVFRDTDIFTPETLAFIRDLTDIIERHDGVQRVLSLSNAEVALGEEDTVAFEPVLPDGEVTPEVAEASRAMALSHAILTGQVISADGTTTCLLVELLPFESNEEKGKVIRSIQAAADAASGGRRLRYSGGPCVEVEINALTRRDNMLFTPVTFLIIMVIVYLMLRNTALSLLGQVNIVIIVLWGIGLLVMCGEVINTVTVVIAPVLLAISIADSIHILSHYRTLYTRNGRDHRAAVGEAARNLWRPCLFTSLTTGMGYLSFVTTTVRPVKIVGVFTAMGVMIAFFMSVLVLPAFLMGFRKSVVKRNREKAPLARESGDPVIGLLSWLGEWVVSHSGAVMLLFLVAAAGVGYGMTRLRFDTDFAAYLKDGNRVKEDIRFVESNIRGTVPVEMVIEAVSPETDFTHPQGLKTLGEVAEEIMAHMAGQYTHVFSVADYIAEIHEAFTGGESGKGALPESRMDLRDYYELADPEVLERTVSPDYRMARISFASKFGSNANAEKVRAFAEARVGQILGDGYRYRFTGLSSLYNTMDRNLKISQIRSFGTAFVLIFVMMFFVCRSPLLAVISMVPNLFPICTTLGIMGWVGIPLDTSTIMIASVTIGIAVDDTIHFVTWFRRNCEAGLCTREALLKTFRDTGKPIVMTSVVLCTAYFVFMTGSVKPVIAFGALAGLSMFFALLGDLLILPALIYLVKPALCREEAEAMPQGDVSDAL
ncbi:efflux RND transporter permease subunit [Desulfoluna spongiiphila]|uniref:efflux RND transporter permease subunit n=1 Tax=Desulfoluna spongiiphila TaxID=419481 RepID=UPI0012512E1A|nr:efflux RND transporter permease subunit [Desulfoluna spongiiphila]VVS94931.1 membrane transport protein mmpl domain [Desulfoluna spongiiphila]